MRSLKSIAEWADAVNRSEKAVIVEGKSDEAALRSLALKNRIYRLGKHALFEVIEQVSSREKDVIILTDLDREGKKLYGTLSSGLQNHGTRIDNRFREWIFKNTKVRQIEGLKMESKVNENS